MPKRYYFHISNGLRGCYMPDNQFVVSVTTRRELKRVLEAELYYLGDSYTGPRKRAIASFAKRAWETRGEATLDHCLPLRIRYQSSASYGFFASAATKADFEAYLEEIGQAPD